MRRQTHIALRCLAVTPILGAIALAQAQSANADLAVSGEGASLRTISTVPALAPAANATTIPPLFAGTRRMASPSDADDLQPELIGIAGRLPDDVEILLRLPEGRTRSVRIGEQVGEWQLISATADRAIFSDRGREVVLTLGPLP